MKKQSLYFSLIFILLTLGLSACNDDVFVEPLKVSTGKGEIGPDNKTLFIGISGSNWSVKDICYYDAEGSTRPDYSDDAFRVSTAFTKLDMDVKRNGLEIHLTSYLGKEPGSLVFTVTSGGYEYHDVNIHVLPTGTYDINIEDVSYVFDQWSGYPDENFTDKVIIYKYPEGLSEATSFVFPTQEHANMLYKFEPMPDADTFAQRVLNSGILVPIPTYGPFAGNTTDFWVMKGQEAKLTTNRSAFLTTYLPPVPAAVELPAGKPLAVILMCEYESIGLDCTIKAVNPATELTETIECKLRMDMPNKYRVKVVDL